MAPRRCTIRGCPSVSGRQQHRGVTFHTFPLNPIARQFWLTNCNLPDTKSITKSILVCSRHFRRADFQPLKNNKYLLKQGAVPTIFPWGTLPYVEPTPHAVIESGQSLANIAEEKPGEINQELIDEIVKIKSELKATIGVKSPSKRSASVDEPGTSEPKKKSIRVSLDSKKLPSESIAPTTFDPFAKFAPGTRIEAQDFNEVWHAAKVMEVDSDEKEVLINFEKNSKSKTPATVTEWIPMNSSRLRPLQVVKKPIASYVAGEKVFARWTDSRKFPATIQKILENNTYEVLFDDGFVKVVRAGHISKVKIPEPKTPKSGGSGGRKSNSHLPIPKFDLAKLNLLPVPKDGEWCCNWVNEIPIGAEGYLDGPDGHKRPTVLVEDWRLPAGWTKHLYQRSSVSGKWDVVLVGPTKKRFRSKNDVKVYLEEKGESYNPDIYDFSIHKRRAKDIGLFVFTEEYKEEMKNKQLLAASNAAAAAAAASTPKSINTSDDAFPGFTSKESSFLSTTLLSTALIASGNTAMNLTPTATNVPLSLTPQTIPPTPPPQPQQPSEPGFVYVGALKVQLIDNLFHCPEESCNKNFRKENHLQIHVKHYHEELAKLLGVCPNMSDLAYQRTVGMPIDETVPKNQIPNSQFFEKVYLSDLNSRTPRKSMSPSTQVKLDHKSPNAVEKSVAVAEVEKPLTETIAQPHDTSGILNQIINDVKIEEITQVQDCIGQSPIKTEVFTHDADIVNVRKNDTPAIRLPKATKRKSIKPLNRQKNKRNMKKALMKSLEEAKSSMVKDLGDMNDLRHSLGGGSELSPTKSSRLKFLQPMDGTNKASVHEHIPDMGSSHPKYINENGEVIKIVRMRQEEIINCLCSYVEEDGLMIQCELCLCWQHGICNGIEKESQVPEKYVCYICRNPQRGRESMKYVHDQDWLHAGKLPVATYHGPNAKHAERFDMLKQSHTLTGNLIELKRFMHSLKVKINIAENKDHPKMYLWSKKWEKSPLNSELTGIELLAQPDKLESKFNTNETLNQLFSNVEVKKDEKKDEINATLESAMETSSANEEKPTTDPVKEEVGLTEEKPHEFIDDKMMVDQSILAGLLHNSGAANMDRVQKPVTVKVPQPEAAINPSECQLRLLDHIQKQQSLVMSRLQTIEAQIIALECRDDKMDVLEPVESCSKTKQIISLLLNDLQKMRRIAVINSIENKLEI